MKERPGEISWARANIDKVLGRLIQLNKKTQLGLLGVPLVLLVVFLTLDAPGPSSVPESPPPVASSELVDAVPVAEVDVRVGADAPLVVENAPAGQVVPPREVPSKTPSDPRSAFLLLGYGGGGHDGAYLTDSMMVAIIDPNQKTVALLSLPRDAWVPMLFDGRNAVYGKINTAYALARDSSLYKNRLARYTGKNGAGNFAVDTVSRILGIPISNYLGLDFAGFRQMIDAVGGVEVTVLESFAAQYPANDNPAIDPSWKVVSFRKGVERMYGERAIQFARAREVLDNANEGSDFARSRRQRIIMDAFRARLFEPGGLIHLPQILTIMQRHVDTDYGLANASDLSQLVLNWKNVRTYQAALTPANYLRVATGPGGAYVLIPSAADHSWEQVRAFARRLWDDPPTAVAMADTSIVVANDTGVDGLGTRLSAVLTKLGFRVGSPAPGREQAESRLLDGTGGKAAPVVTQLGKDLGVNLRQVAEKPVGNSNTLVLHLGADNKALASLPVSPDHAAPSSVVGIQNFETWVPYVEPPEPEQLVDQKPGEPDGARSTLNPTGSPTVTVTPRGTALPRPTATPPRAESAAGVTSPSR